MYIDHICICFNSSLVRLGVIQFKLDYSLIDLFQFQLGAIGSTEANNMGGFTNGFNSSLVRLGVLTLFKPSV